MMTEPDIDDLSTLAGEIASWLRESVQRANATHLVLGLSGGVDSAVVCALAARAVGSEKVIAAIMPIHSDEQDTLDAEMVAVAFAVKPVFINLVPAYEAMLSALEPQRDNLAISALSMARSNTKPRLRMTALYYLSQLHNGLVVGTGNKVELSIGYFTKYGDGGVDLLPIADLTKSEVRALALELGVPKSIVAKPPSAGLWPGQTDEDEIGLTYDQIERAIQSASNDDQGEETVANRVREMIVRSDHKRSPVPEFQRDGGH